MRIPRREDREDWEGREDREDREGREEQAGGPEDAAGAGRSGLDDAAGAIVREPAVIDLRQFVAASEDAVMVMAGGEPHAVLYVNAAMERLTGLGAGDLLGRSPAELLACTTGEIWQTDLARLFHAAAAGETFRGEIVNCGTDGAEHHLDLRVEPLREPGGAPSHWIVVGRDITRQRVAEVEQVRLKMRIYRSALEWQQTFDSIALPVLVLDGSGRVSRLNDAARKLAGRTFSECLTRTVDALGAGEPWLGAARLVEETLHRGSAARERRTRGGKTWEIVTHPLAMAAGLIVTLHDLTDLVQLEESLRHGAAMSAMGFLVAGVAHEARNPLFGLTALLDSYDSQPESSPPFPVADFRRGLKRLQNLMQQLLDYGQAAPQERAPQALLPTLREARETCLPLAQERGVEIVLAAGGELAPVDMDADRMLQVFQNLLDNALRYSPADAQVLITAEMVQGWVECRIDDAGPGIAPADRASIFDPFFTRRRGGTGLGLAIVQRIVVEHGGTVLCRERAGAGTCMVVRLPPAGRDPHNQRDQRDQNAPVSARLAS